MPKHPPAGKCVYCLQEYDELTWDHVFPRSWYPISTPRTLEKWGVPCCQQCNNRFSKIEEDLITRLGLCLDRSHPGAQGITERVLRSLDPKCARDERDRHKRQRKRQKFLKEIQRTSQVPKIGVLPNFGINRPIPPTGVGVVRVWEKDLYALGEKLIRGFTYVLTGSFIEYNYEIGIVPAERDKAQFYIDLVTKFGATHYRGPGLEITRAQTVDDPMTSGFFIRIWGKLDIYGFVQRKSLGDV
jgi:hypothetical protein